LWSASDRDIVLWLASDRDIVLWSASDRDIVLWSASDRDIVLLQFKFRPNALQCNIVRVILFYFIAISITAPANAIAMPATNPIEPPTAAPTGPATTPIGTPKAVPTTMPLYRTTLDVKHVHFLQCILRHRVNSLVNT
uniref:WD_REPEATS_REGION domain-containing protein n=1 Tax=Anisakis simplex TaxID=6269 RepID=A0A0M3J9C1_ANISI